MAIKRYFATKDNTITNAYQFNLVTRGTGSSMGQADILEVFSIYGQESTSSSELCRFMLQFDTTAIAADRASKSIPVSGECKFYLQIYNARHSQSLPRDYSLNIYAVSSSWQEGNGIDMVNYTDLTYDQVGSNWIRRSGSTSWTAEGGDFHAAPAFTAEFPIGTEDMKVDVTTLVEQWLAGTKDNYGFHIKLPPSLEDSQISYYTKKFFGRDSEFWFKRPTLEVRWDSSIKDNRGNFYTSSSLAPANDNLNTLYLYNFVRGNLTNIPGVEQGELFLDLYASTGSTATAETLCLNTPVTGGWVSTGIYSASVCIETTSSLLYDVWYSGSVGSYTQYHTGSVSTDQLVAQDYSLTNTYILSVTNQQTLYYPTQNARFRLFARTKGWSPNIYTVAQSTVPTLVFESASYQITRTIDDQVVVPYGTGSQYSTMLSYDVSGNYFDFDMSMLEAGYSYGIHFSLYDSAIGSYVEQPSEFKFKVNKYDY
jgi:hypothetical protein